MNTAVALDRTLTRLDHVRLARLVAAGAVPPAAAEPLEDLLTTSDLVDSQGIPADVVTMYSQVMVQDEAGGAPQKLTLCYPEDAEPAQGFISVLSPVGTALLGLSVGQVARWQPPAGPARCTRVTQILFQPEATGDYTT